MASVLQLALPSCSYYPSQSKSPLVSALGALHFPKTHHFSTIHRRRKCNFNRGLVCQSSSGEVTFIEPPQAAKSKDDLIRSLKIKLLSAVSGLNRGLAASEDDLQKADAAAKELESAGGSVNLSDDLDKLQGRWKLIYSSALSSRTLGGGRPGLPSRTLRPITLGQVLQRIDVISKDFDNIYELEFGAPWPLPPLEFTATLANKFEVIGSCGIKIMFDKTTVKATGNLSQLPPLDIPQVLDALRLLSNTGTFEFEVTYLDSDTRISRGDRGELRVFVTS